MAQSLATIRSKNLTEIYGRRLGLYPETHPNAPGFLGGVSDLVRVVTDLTSGSSATPLPNHGYVNINVTSAGTTVAAAGGTFLLSNPAPGVSVKIFSGVQGTTSTQGSTTVALIRPTTAFLLASSEGTTMTTVLLSFGCGIELHGITTDLYRVGARMGAASSAGEPGISINGTT